MQNNQEHWLERLGKGIIKVCMFLADLCMAGMITLVCVNCFLRYAVGQPIYWGDEIMIYLMILMAYLAFGTMMLEGRHIRMTALMGRLSEKAQNRLWMVLSLINVAYCCFLLAGGIYMTWDSFATDSFSTITGDPIGPWQALVCFGLVVLIIGAVLFAINKIRMARGVKAAENEEIQLEA